VRHKALVGAGGRDLLHRSLPALGGIIDSDSGFPRASASIGGGFSREDTAVADIFDETVFAPVHTFMGAPQSWDLANAKAAVLGIPFDAGTHPVRIGARLGPASIREQSALVRRYEPPLHNFDPVRNLGLVDCGNVRVTPGVIGESFATIEEAVSRVAQAGAVPLAMGGDGMISLPQMRALHRLYPDLCVLHLTRTPMPTRTMGRASVTATIPAPPSPAPPTRRSSIPATRCMSARAARPTRSARSTRRSNASTA
jgi:hypothetical protein